MNLYLNVNLNRHHALLKKHRHPVPVHLLGVPVLMSVRRLHALMTRHPKHLHPSVAMNQFPSARLNLRQRTHVAMNPGRNQKLSQLPVIRVGAPNLDIGMARSSPVHRQTDRQLYPGRKMVTSVTTIMNESTRAVMADPGDMGAMARMSIIHADMIHAVCPMVIGTTIPCVVFTMCLGMCVTRVTGITVIITPT